MICILVTHYHVSNHNYVFCYMAAEVCMLFFKYEKAFSLWLESHMLICQLLDFDPRLAQLLWDQGLCSIYHNKHWGRWGAGVTAAELSDVVSYMLATACSKKSCAWCLQLLQKGKSQNFQGTQTFNSTGGLSGFWPALLQCQFCWALAERQHHLEIPVAILQPAFSAGHSWAALQLAPQAWLFWGLG